MKASPLLVLLSAFALSSPGLRADVVFRHETAGITQPWSPIRAGAALAASTLPAGTVLYTVKLDLASGATPGTVFDGLNAPIAAFNGVLRTRAGVDVVSRNGFGIGRLTVIGP